MRIQFRIRTLVFAVVVVAIGLGALSRPSPAAASLVFTLALGLPLAAIVKAVASRGRERLPWIGFCLFGLGFLRASFNLPGSSFAPSGPSPPPESIVSVTLSELSRFVNPEVRAIVEEERNSMSSILGEAGRVRRAAYFNCCASLGSLFMALLGGLLGYWLSLQPQVQTARNRDEGEGPAPTSPIDSGVG